MRGADACAGVVHDEKAYLMNGVAGHAGLFGPARDVAALAEPYLAAANGRASRGLSARSCREAVVEHGADPVLRRGLGWALKTSDENSCGAAMSRSTFGHTGFTGTSVWADPERDLSIVLLTNAVYYGRNDLRDLRAAVCDAAALGVRPVRAIGLMSGTSLDGIDAALVDVRADAARLRVTRPTLYNRTV